MPEADCTEYVDECISMYSEQVCTVNRKTVVAAKCVTTPKFNRYSFLYNNLAREIIAYPFEAKGFKR